eukprot:CAMPEP_0201697262 /NCGR_PEP_ID=MMETSP0578-20130828/10296_1 /ASSEMBLY_ACC=CAM_ASM_000663 /TAXON_ID=267565 /ORGANISM="Skeletonema grethea, Strain CCMP 1804" /LENGTH=235 /DNA_ID=CAMNT_0048183387 /DNA_START=14 /DNA_END=721 /DNA_ORIENTATION=+
MPKKKASKKQKTSTANKAKESVSIKIRNMSMIIMGETASGSKDKKIKHSVQGSNGSVILAFDGKPTPEGKKFLKMSQKYDGSVEEWMKVNDAEGSRGLAKVLMNDTVITQLVPEKFVPKEELEGDSFDLKNDVLVKLVKMQTEKEDVLMPLFFETGTACSTGGYMKRAECLLANNIPFFYYLFSELHVLFDIKALWMRASEEGTHGKHSDQFRRGATHRGILSINCLEKKMSFER